MATYLDRILAEHRATAAEDGRPLDPLLDQARAMPPTRGFRASLADHAGLAVIAEVKRRSPSAGPLRTDLDPGDLARSYAAGGAACLSVLTDAASFGGSVEDLVLARASCALPVLRKDFTVSERDVADTRAMGADAVLLIAAALDDAQLGAFWALATDLGLDALVEVHDEPELARALGVGATLVGVNQRDLTTFAVDTDRAVRMAPLMPAGVLAVAESGVRDAEDARRLAAAGYRAVLVGESLVTAEDPAAVVAALQGHGHGSNETGTGAPPT